MIPRIFASSWCSELADSGRVDVILTTGVGWEWAAGQYARNRRRRLRTGSCRESGKRRKGAVLTPTQPFFRGGGGGTFEDAIKSAGKSKGSVRSLDAVAHLLPHAVNVLHGARHTINSSAASCAAE
jgi:hypothetical protein